MASTLIFLGKGLECTNAYMRVDDVGMNLNKHNIYLSSLNFERKDEFACGN